MQNLFLAMAAAVAMTFAAQAQTLDEALQNIANFKFGEDREPQSVVNDLVRKADNAGGDERKSAEAKLLALLKANPSPDCVDFLCRQLMIIGSEASVPVLEPMLTKDEKSADWARYALECIDGEAVDKALIKAATQTSGRARAGILNSLGNRKSKSAVSTLASFTTNQDKAVASAAIAALGQIGGDDAAQAIAKARSGNNKPVADDAYIACATSFIADGKSAKAEKILNELSADAETPHVRAAAVIALAKANPDATQKTLMGFLKGDDAYLRAVAVGILRNTKEESATRAVARALPSLDPGAQVLALGILEHHGDRASLGAVAKAAASEDPAVRAAAVRAVGVLGDASSVPMLVSTATTGANDVKQIANDSLNSLRGADVDQKMLDEMSGADTATRSVLIRTLAARGAKAALPALYESTGDTDEGIRANAFDALGTLAGPGELPKLVDLLAKMNGNSAQPQAESAVVAVSQKVDDSGARAKAVLDALDASRDEKVRTSYTRVAGRIADSSALSALRELAAQSKEASVQDAAVRALADWPTAETLGDLRTMAAEAKNDTFRALAFNGMIRVARMEGGPDIETQLAVYTEGLALAKSPDEKRLVLAGLGRVADPRALELARKLEGDEAVKEEAKQAIEQITKSLEPK
ncbi:MAG: HEAT repeat domain-containing protein [Candidatus Hydrogenedentes bacterium]|nr:HEAT repeat domain-containing protein [Candidatus Hydrogenedentota bacterium]